MRAFFAGFLGLVSFTCVVGCGSSDDGQRHCNDEGSGNNLSGSYCEDIDMAFTEVKLLTVSGGLRIEYLRPVGMSSEKTLQIIIDGSKITPNTEVKLLEAGAQVRRLIVGAQAPQTLTGELEPQSSITFNEYTSDATGPMIGSRVVGKFSMLFKSGRTLAGDFEGTIQDARPQG